MIIFLEANIALHPLFSTCQWKRHEPEKFLTCLLCGFDDTTGAIFDQTDLKLVAGEVWSGLHPGLDQETTSARTNPRGIISQYQDRFLIDDLSDPSAFLCGHESIVDIQTTAEGD